MTNNIKQILKKIRKEQKENIVFINGKPYFKSELNQINNNQMDKTILKGDD